MPRNITRILESKVVRDNTSSLPKVIHTERIEWTPGTPEEEMRVPIRSTWRDAIGKPLTSRRIRQLESEGWYGEDKRQKQKAIAVPVGIVVRCKCGTKSGVRYVRYSYLPNPGYYCGNCVKIAKAERDKELELDRKWKENVRREYA